MLCGLHCVNAMLQGPYFDEVSLAQIALQLDEEEAALLGKGQKGFKAQNVALDGMYNVQVLSRALQQFAQLSVEPMRDSGAASRE